MRKRISIVIVLIFSYFLFCFPVSAGILTEKMKSEIEEKSPVDSEFNLIYGNKNLEEDYLYSLKYIPYDNTSDSINGAITYDYLLTDKYNHSYTMNVIYGITNSFGSSLSVKIGSTVLYEIKVTDTAGIYQLGEYDFTEVTDDDVHIQSYSYKADFISDDMDKIALLFEDATKLCYLSSYHYTAGKSYTITVSSEYAVSSDEIIVKSLNDYEYIKDSEIISSDYNPSSMKIKPGSYTLRYAVLDIYGNYYVDTYHIEAEDDKNYFMCDDIEVDSLSPINSENIFKYYVHFYDKENVTSYEIKSDYQTHANQMGTYSYQVILYVGEEKYEYPKEAYITVKDMSYPELSYEGKASGDGTYLPVEEMFTSLKATDTKDGDLSDKIVITDVNDYKNNYGTEGTYVFILSVKDAYGNETLDYFYHTVTIKKEEPEVIPEEKEEEETEEEKEILYEFYAKTGSPLTRTLFRQKLVFSGFYEETDNISIASDYFDNKEIPGTYLVTVTKDEEIKYYEITVSQETVDSIENEVITDNDDFDYGPVIVGVVIGACALGIIIYLILNRKKKKETQE